MNCMSCEQRGWGVISVVSMTTVLHWYKPEITNFDPWVLFFRPIEPSHKFSSLDFLDLRFIQLKYHFCRLPGRVVKSHAIVIETVSVQNLLAPFCCVLGKETLQHFPLLAGLNKL